MSDTVTTQRVTWIELFYDVIVAASMLLIYGSLAKHLSWPEFFWLSAIALVVFAMWLSTTLVFNRMPGDSTWRRIFVIAQMIALIYAVASMESSDRVDGDVGITALGCALLVLAVMWEAVRRATTPAQPVDRIAPISFAIGGMFLLSATFLPDALNSAIFITGALVGFVPMFVKVLPRLFGDGLIDVHHLAERLGGLVLIMLGETFLEMAVLFTKGAEPRVFGVLLVFIVLVLVWWMYFTFVSGVPRAGSRVRLDWYLFGHAVTILGLGAGALALTEVGLALTEELSLPVIAGILGGSLALVYAGLALIASTTAPSDGRVWVLAGAATVFAGLGLAFWSVWEADEQVLSLVTAAVSLVALLLTAAISSRSTRQAAPL